MSTKIYCAYRFPITRVEKGIQHFHELLLEGSLISYTTALNMLTVERFNAVATDEDNRLTPKSPEKVFSIEAKIIALQDMLVLGDEYIKSLYDSMSCGFNAWFHDGFVYVIPWGSYRPERFLESAEHPEWIEEFGYWDNTDPPDEFRSEPGYARWKERGSIWEKVGPGGYKPGPEPGCLTHEVVDFSRFTGSYELVKLYRKRNGLKSPWT